MLQSFIGRSARQPPLPAAKSEATSVPGRLRKTDWLLGGSVATLAVVFVAGLLGLRSNTADLQDQSRSNARALTALKADTVERINGIAGDLAKTNQTLTDLIALRAKEKAPGAFPAAGEVPSRTSGRAAAKAAAPREAKASGAKATLPKPVARPTLLGPLTVRRAPARERAEEARRRAKKTEKPVAAQKAEPKPSTEAVRLRREAALRQLRLRRLAKRASG